MQEIKFQIDASKALGDLRRFSAEKLRKADDAIMNAAFYLEGEVKLSIAGQRAENKSVDTGKFMQSVKGTREKRFAASVSSDVNYAKFLEFGTSKMGPRAHFRNSLARSKDRIIRFIGDSVK